MGWNWEWGQDWDGIWDRDGNGDGTGMGFGMGMGLGWDLGWEWGGIGNGDRAGVRVACGWICPHCWEPHGGLCFTHRRYRSRMFLLYLQGEETFSITPPCPAISGPPPSSDRRPT